MADSPLGCDPAIIVGCKESHAKTHKRKEIPCAYGRIFFLRSRRGAVILAPCVAHSQGGFHVQARRNRRRAGGPGRDRPGRPAERGQARDLGLLPAAGEQGRLAHACCRTRASRRAEQKAEIAKTGGVDWDKLKEAWDYNAAVEGATGLLVIRHGHIVGEWYKDCDTDTDLQHLFQLEGVHEPGVRPDPADRQRSAGKLPGGKKLTLDTKVCNEEWLPESLPLPDPRKADITRAQPAQHGVRPRRRRPCRRTAPFESALGTTEKSPFAKLKADPGTEFQLLQRRRRAPGAGLPPGGRQGPVSVPEGAHLRPDRHGNR